MGRRCDMQAALLALEERRLVFQHTPVAKRLCGPTVAVAGPMNFAYWVWTSTHNITTLYTGYRNKNMNPPTQDGYHLSYLKKITVAIIMQAHLSQVSPLNPFTPGKLSASHNVNITQSASTSSEEIKVGLSMVGP